MTADQNPIEYPQTEDQEPLQRVAYDFGVTRRSFVKVLGAGLLITVSARPSWPSAGADRAAAAG